MLDFSLRIQAQISPAHKLICWLSELAAAGRLSHANLFTNPFVLRDSTQPLDLNGPSTPQTISSKCVLFSKLANYMGRSLEKLIAPADKH
jgi:hypothetical protein